MHKILLLHGYHKTPKDMQVLGRNLSLLGFECESVRLPLTFQTIEACAELFAGVFERYTERLAPGEKVSLAGHSSGGLVIRQFLAESPLASRVHRAVLIGTPNSGTVLADIAAKYVKPYVRLFKTMQSLQSSRFAGLPAPPVETGAIAGSRNDLLLGRLLSPESDGRVEISSVQIEGLTDFLILPYNHLQIHYEMETAAAVARFIRTGRFAD
ncbi:alpha/beta hydrolase [Paenibacillus pinistramenti]|uniref:alpha/beta hydrolase n=1 Tax=Paenibacillus pinistramenti TaxID=1768003 RepID=UPI001108B63B|nr:alpha/beta hydrolase [Paenibacillus pinistramenti]